MGLAVLVGVGCRTPLEGPAQVTGAARQGIYEEAERHFARAHLVTPENHLTAGLENWLCPIIVLESTNESNGYGARSEGFGAVRAEPGGRVQLDVAKPTLYLVPGRVKVRGADWETRTFLWYEHSTRAKDGLRFVGYRVLLSADGRGLVWEVLDSDTVMKVFFVSEPLEAEARLRVGPPLEGRRYAMEPDEVLHPEVVVARLLSEEPEPMGPFVYVRQADRGVTSLQCRCMPTQVEELAGESFYQLVTLQSWSELVGHPPVPINLPLPKEEREWWKVLRWPDDTEAGPSL